MKYRRDETEMDIKTSRDDQSSGRQRGTTSIWWKINRASQLAQMYRVCSATRTPRGDARMAFSRAFSRHFDALEVVDM